MADKAIQVMNVSKVFRLPHERTSSLKGAALEALKGNFGNEYEEQQALKDINLDIEKGEFFGVVGRNGSGKSTLLKILAEIYQPTNGSVEVAGRLVPFIELGVGFNGELSGRDNVYLNGALLGFSESEIDARYEEIVAFAELERFMDQKLKNYSSGMQVRLAFSLAIQTDADVLLVDEVLAVGDASFQRKCYDYFRILKKNKKTVVLVTHDMSAIREYCTRAALINQSEIVLVGSPDEVADAYDQIFIDDLKDEADAASAESKELLRTGNKKLEIKKITLPAKVTAKDAEIEVKVTVKANDNVDSPEFGTSIQDASGTRLFGTNSTTNKQKTPDFKKGDTKILRWVYPNILADGKHALNFALTSKDGLVQYDVWKEAKTITSFRSPRTPYPIQPTITLEVEK